MLKRLYNKIGARVSPKTKRQVVFFILVGMLNTLFSYVCYAFFIYYGLHYAFAALLATCLGIIFNFNTTGKIVFNNLQFQLIFKFIGVYLFLYCLNVSILTLLTFFSSNNYLNGFIAIFPLATIAFVLNKFLVFKEKKEKYEIN